MGAAFGLIFGGFLIYLGTLTRPWRTKKDRPPAEWAGDVVGSVVIAGIGVLAMAAALRAPAAVTYPLVVVWLVAITATAGTWVWFRWREAHAPRPVPLHAPRPIGATASMLGWLFAAPVLLALVLSGSAALLVGMVPAFASQLSARQVASTLTPLLAMATVVTAPAIWLVQALRRRRWEDRQRAYEHLLTGLEPPPVPSLWQTLRNVMGL